MGEIEQVWADSILNIIVEYRVCNMEIFILDTLYHYTIKSCLDLLPNTINLTIQCDTTTKNHIFLLMGTHPKKMAFLPKYTWG